MSPAFSMNFLFILYLLLLLFRTYFVYCGQVVGIRRRMQTGTRTTATMGNGMKNGDNYYDGRTRTVPRKLRYHIV